MLRAGLSSLGVLADQLTLFQPGGRADYAHLITTGTPGFSDLPTALQGSNLVTTFGDLYYLNFLVLSQSEKLSDIEVSLVKVNNIQQ